MVQCFVCNDYVNMHLNFQKFNITQEDLVNAMDIKDEYSYYWKITKNEHTLTFHKNLESMSYIYLNYSIDFENNVDATYFDFFEDVLFYGKPYLRLKCENLSKVSK